MGLDVTPNLNYEGLIRRSYDASTLTGDQLDSAIRKLVQTGDIVPDSGKIVEIVQAGAYLGVSATSADVRLALIELRKASATPEEFALGLTNVMDRYPEAMRAIIGATKVLDGSLHLIRGTLALGIK